MMTTAAAPALKAPFPFFGGKRRVAALVWERLGDVRNFVEPFAGSLAVLLGRPHAPGIETVNDLDCMIANFWRALHADPEAVAAYADWPVNEADLHARHRWLLALGRERTERLKTDPDFYDVQVAGWWAWGQSAWIGSGWCAAPSAKLPHLGDAGRGVHRPSQQLPHLGDAGRVSLTAYFVALAARLRRVRVCCGDWTRVLGPTPTTRQGLTGVFLDPPYGASRASRLYATDSTTVQQEVCAWAVAHGDDPKLRIALCSYGEEPCPPGWTRMHWKAAGGYGSQGTGRGRTNATRETIDFSPHCLAGSVVQSETSA